MKGLKVSVVLVAALFAAAEGAPGASRVPAASSILAGKSPVVRRSAAAKVVSEAMGSKAVTKAGRGGAAAAVIAGEWPPAIKLLFGVGGIYGAFMYYGLLQERVFSYAAADGAKFSQVWFLMVLEALANVVVGFLGMHAAGPTKGLPLNLFAATGVTQVSAKAFTNLALRAGVSFPVVTLAKSGKMVPVMVGSILLGGASYSLREYAQVGMIIFGTVLVSMKKGKKGGDSSMVGVAMIMASLTCDGITGGMQKRIKGKSAELGVKAKPYDFMYWTNLFMMLTATAVALVGGEFVPGVKFCSENPVILRDIAIFSACSAVGQSFIFYTISNFEPLVCSTVTTTRKIFSVLLSIFVNNHKLDARGWTGIGVACLGIVGELQDKASKQHQK